MKLSDELPQSQDLKDPAGMLEEFHSLPAVGRRLPLDRVESQRLTVFCARWTAFEGLIPAMGNVTPNFPTIRVMKFWKYPCWSQTRLYEIDHSLYHNW